jgi:hypothetical protein
MIFKDMIYMCLVPTLITGGIYFTFFYDAARLYSVDR